MALFALSLVGTLYMKMTLFIQAIDSYNFSIVFQLGRFYTQNHAKHTALWQYPPILFLLIVVTIKTEAIELAFNMSNKALGLLN